MGSVSLNIGDGTARFRRASFCSSAVNLVMLLSVLTTNLFALYAFTSTPPQPHNPTNISLISDHVSGILRQIQTSQKKLSQMERSLFGYDALDLSHSPAELNLFLARHPLPLGRDAKTGITHMVSSVAHSCAKSQGMLFKFASYKPFLLCPNDQTLAENLVSRGCDPLPRRRCLSRPSLAKQRIPTDDLSLARLRGKNDFAIDDVLALSGGIRIGVDVAGGDGVFAARMAERNVTIVTTTVAGGAGAAARGVFPLMVSPDQRLPFHDSVFDLAHTVTGLDGAEEERLEFLMFDLDRVLRVGGLLWLDNYRCLDEKRKLAMTVLIEKFKYKKLKWVVGEKAGAVGKVVLLSAVLQKPLRG